ncbi:MAG TPA: sigma-70 family RNA polymerase sigma factor [Rhodoblastus sp.]|nr:sigma-70 family RNA polymerase sigma factor [Rhodoblastus sp.]
MTSEIARRLFAERIIPHLDDAYGLARWLTGNTADAQDVVQDACLRALAAIERAQAANARAWFMTVVRNAAYTWLARNRPKAVVVEPQADAPDDAPSAEAALIARADAATLERAIDALPLVFRETLVMREFNELSYREIADATGAPIGTIMSRLARARALLVTALKEAG